MKSLVVRKWVCRLLVLILTLSGMYMEGVNADFSNTCMEEEICRQHIRREERMLVDWGICTEEQMGNEMPDACVQRAARSRKLIESREILDLVQEYPGCALTLFERHCAEHMQKNSGRSIAVCYAHRQDGKKNNLSVFGKENGNVFIKEIN